MKFPGPGTIASTKSKSLPAPANPLANCRISMTFSRPCLLTLNTPPCIDAVSPVSGSVADSYSCVATLVETLSCRAIASIAQALFWGCDRNLLASKRAVTNFVIKSVFVIFVRLVLAAVMALAESGFTKPAARASMLGLDDGGKASLSDLNG